MPSGETKVNSNVSETQQTDNSTSAPDNSTAPTKDSTTNSSAATATSSPADTGDHLRGQKAPKLYVNLERWKLKENEKPSFKRRATIEAAKLSILFFLLSPICLFQLTRILLFFPDQTKYDLSQPFHLIQQKLKTNVQEVRFKSANGKLLHGTYFAKEGAKQVLLFSHGNGGNIAHRLPAVIHMLNLGASVLVYDYQGYGQSEGDPSVGGIVEDGIGAYDFLNKVKGWKPSQIIAYGESLGCAVTCQISKQREVAGVVLQSGFSSLPTAARDRFIWLNLFPDFTFPQPQLNNCEILAQSKVPLLLIHGEKDEILPIKYADQMYKAATAKKQFIRLKHSGHNDVLNLDLKEYTAALGSFMKSLDAKT